MKVFFTQASYGKPPVIISGFPGIGKSFLTKDNADISDSDSSTFPKNEFPVNYLNHIENLLTQNLESCLVSSHQDVRLGLQERDIRFVLVYPDNHLKKIFMERYVKRGSPEGFLKLMETNWDNFIDSCKAQTGCTHYVLQADQYLADIYPSILRQYYESN